jgi:hypothetical protein
MNRSLHLHLFHTDHFPSKVISVSLTAWCRHYMQMSTGSPRYLRNFFLRIRLFSSQKWSKGQFSRHNWTISPRIQDSRSKITEQPCTNNSVFSLKFLLLILMKCPLLVFKNCLFMIFIITQAI